ncbi:universal stress protein [Arthrobacter sp. 260]|uniref:universal stress protein n=1 Tax=Arthrobacter sp. 260 TaxID=2735314 RepID=UPI001491C135|nr:universal stress protein [Arthrobacter sp. 260]NOJ58869.1 universal stress protein [Arthrobacter sp. 260]
MTDAQPSSRVREHPIVVAFRDQVTGPAILRWAVARSALTGHHVTVLHAIPDPSLVPPVAAGGTPYGSLIAAARQMLDEESRKVCTDYPAAHVTANVHSGDIVDALVNLSADASLIVVGADRMDHRNGEYLGSVGQQVVLGSFAPVVVIPRDAPAVRQEDGAVVVGVDGSAESLTALQAAATEASSANRGLAVVTAVDGSTEDPFGEGKTQETLAEVQAAHPGLVVSRVVDRERAPTEALSFHAAGAYLLVIGRHGRGARPGIQLGSVTHTLLLTPQCPTLVVTRR